MLKNDGYNKFVASLDKPSAQYGDFHEYYYLVGKLILLIKKPLGGYFYTPSFGIFLNLFSRFRMSTAMVLWGVFQHILLLLLAVIPGIYLASKNASIRYHFFYLILCLTSFPLFHNIKWGQVSILLTLLMILTYIAYEKKYEWLSATILSLAICVKYYPAFLVLYFLFKKDYKYIAKLIFMTAIIGLLFPAAFLGIGKTIEFYQLSLSEISEASGWVAQDPNSQYFAYVIQRMTGTLDNNSVTGLLTILGFALCLIVMFRIYNNSKNGESDILNYTSLILLFPFLISTSWPHYFSYLPFVITVALSKIQISKMKNASYSVSFLFFASIAQSTAMFSLIQTKDLYVSTGFLMFANLMILGISYPMLENSTYLERE